MNIYLDHTYTATKPVILLVDCRVALFKLLNRYNKSKLATECWEYYFNALPSLIHSSIKDVSLMVVDDWRTGTSANYWRETWLRKNYSEGLVYKGNRGSPFDRPEGYCELLEACHTYCKDEGIPLYREAGFEADDFAGAAFRVKPDNVQLILVSVDNDWGQLTSEEKDIIMYINGDFKVPISILRGEYEFLQYYKQRTGYNMTSSYDIVEYKHIYGDAGDNIAPGTPRDIIDLRNPPVKPKALDLRIHMNQMTWRPNKSKALVALQKLVKAEYESQIPGKVM